MALEYVRIPNCEVPLAPKNFQAYANRARSEKGNHTVVTCSSVSGGSARVVEGAAHQQFVVNPLLRISTHVVLGIGELRYLFWVRPDIVKVGYGFVWRKAERG